MGGTAEPSSADSHSHHEALCNHCGKCCYKKMIVGRSVFITPFPCEFLDTSTNLCTVYERRHELNPECLSMEAGFKVSAFPLDCPYVPEQAPKNYKPAREDWNWSTEWRQLDELAEEFDVKEETFKKVVVRGPDRPMYIEAFERVKAAEAQRVLWGAGAPGVQQMAPAEPHAAAPSLVSLLRKQEQA